MPRLGCESVAAGIRLLRPRYTFELTSNFEDAHCPSGSINLSVSSCESVIEHLNQIGYSSISEERSVVRCPFGYNKKFVDSANRPKD
jgi:hypothetical protein